MITITQYVGPHAGSPDWTANNKTRAEMLLEACARLEAMAVADGVVFKNNPTTGTGVSGQTFGGFRPQTCPIGAPGSAHKSALAVDRYDPNDAIDKWCFENQDKLAECGVYIEHPDATPGWSHWSIRKPASGNQVFRP